MEKEGNASLYKNHFSLYVVEIFDAQITPLLPNAHPNIERRGRTHLRMTPNRHNPSKPTPCDDLLSPRYQQKTLYLTKERTSKCTPLRPVAIHLAQGAGGPEHGLMAGR